MSLLIPTDDTATEPRKLIAKRTRQHRFNFTSDEETHRKLVQLQRQFTTATIIPSRTLITRMALRRFALEVRSREMRGDREWFEQCAEELGHLAHAGAK